jgi:PAS domain S-box-containing protein
MQKRSLKAASVPNRRPQLVSQFQRRVMESAVVAIAVLDTEGRFVSANLRAVKITAYLSKELKGKPYTSFLAPQDRGRVGKLLKAVLKRGHSLSRVQANLIRKDGTRRTVSFEMGPIRSGGKIAGAVLIAEDITDTKHFEDALGRVQKQFERTLGQDQERLGLALTAARMGVWEWNVRNDIVNWYGEVSDTLSLGIAKIASGHTWLARVHTDDRTTLQESITSALRERREYRVEYRMAFAPEEFRWVEERGMGVYEDTRECVVVRGVLSDITDRKKIEQALTTSEERYRNVVENQTDLICRYRPDTSLTFVNDAYCRYFGRTRDDLIGSSFLELVPKEMHSTIIKHIQGLVLNPVGGEAQHEHQVITPDGGVGWINWVNRVVIKAGKRTNELQGIGRDITQRKRLEEDIVRREQEFSRLVQNSPNIISRLDRNLRFLYVSPVVHSLFGIAPQEFLRKTTREVGVHAHDSPGFEKVCQQAFETGRPVDREFSFNDRWYRSRIIPESDTTGTIETLMCIDEDVTEHKRIELELRLLSSRLLELQDAERRRIARELHDVTAQNLFAINIALTRLLQQKKIGDFRAILEDCLSLCDQSREEIRTLSYLLHPPTLDQAGLVSALKWYVEGFSRRVGIKVDLVVGRYIGRLPMDVETDLFRVVQECLANVHRHSGSSTARVQLDRHADRVVLQVRDWGRGMPAEATNVGALGSLGVGIPGMRERLGQLRGHLEIESGNHGTTVTAVVPLSKLVASGNSDLHRRNG